MNSDRTEYTSTAGKKYVMRPALPSELDVIYNIWKAGMEQHGYAIESDKEDKYRQFLSELIEGQDEIFRFWACEDADGRIVGWQSLMPYTNNPFSRELGGESSTYVSPDAQDRGVAYILLYHVIAHAKKTPLHHVIAFVAEDNYAVEKIGGKLGGWQEVGLLPAADKEPQRPGMKLHINMMSNNR